MVEVEPDLNQDLINQILQMGIPENPAKHALYNTGNDNAERAIAWYFDHMDDANIQLPLLVKKAVAVKE